MFPIQKVWSIEMSIEKTLVQHGATIKANVTIVCGNTIGTYVFRAGAAITKGVASPPLVDNSAQQTGWTGTYGHYLDFYKKEMAMCYESGVN